VTAIRGGELDPGALKVLRVCSVFEAPEAALHGRGVRFDPVGGMQSHTGQLTRELDRRGVRQAVFTHRPPGTPRRERLGRRACVYRFGLPVHHARQLYSAPAAVAALRLAPRADLVHAHLGEDLAVLAIGLAAARRASLPLVVTVHCSLRHTFAGTGPRAYVLKRIGAAIETAVCRRADAVIALTPRLARHLRDDGVAADRVHVIPSGVAAVRFDAEPAVDRFAGAGHPQIVFVGRLAAQKGVQTLVEAAARLRTPGATVLLVGDGPQRPAIERAVERLGIADRVRITGFVAHRDIPAVLRHADVFCLPSMYEELGTALLEAMHAGLPIVASRAGGIPDAVGPAARLVAPGDPAALAEALDALLADAGERTRLAALAAQRARAWEWTELAERVLDVYRRALLPGPATGHPSDPPPAPKVYEAINSGPLIEE
jgi:glycogen(starch) synthase